jgi:hypothetical protein
VVGLDGFDFSKTLYITPIGTGITNSGSSFASDGGNAAYVCPTLLARCAKEAS